MRRFMAVLAATTVLLAVCGVSGMAAAEERNAALASLVLEETAHPGLPMSEVPSARPAQTQHTQLPMGNVCRAGYYACLMQIPAPLGTPCFCPVGFWGTVSLY